MKGLGIAVVTLGLALAACGSNSSNKSANTGGAGGAGTGGSGGTGNTGGSGGGAPGSGPTIAGCPVFPADNEWNRDVSADPVDPNSDAIIAYINANGASKVHPDFGSIRSTAFLTWW